MIVISKHSNQLCNRLFSYLPPLSLALETGERAVFLFQFKDYTGHFPNLESLCSSYLLTSSFNRSMKENIFNGTIKILDKLFHLIQLTDEKDYKPTFPRILFNKGWKNGNFPAFISKHSDELRHLFQPNAEVESRIAARWEHVQEGETIVGIHVRRGDYKTCAPHWFYSLEEYRNFIVLMKKELESKGKKPRFLVCSNERYDSEIFADLPLIPSEGGDMITDLYSLARCNYIAGPPSTYSQWAAFYGNTRLIVLQSRSDHPLIANSVKVLRLDTFEP